MNIPPSDRRRPKSSRRAHAAAEPWEVERLHRELPVKSREELEETLKHCKSEAADPQNKGKMTRCVQRKLSK
jgi:hypothetical protein